MLCYLTPEVRLKVMVINILFICLYIVIYKSGTNMDEGGEKRSSAFFEVLFAK